MGFLSKLFKKAKPYLPFAAAMFMPQLMGSKLMAGGLGNLFGGMNPMAANMLKQSLMGYGSAKLTGSKHPEKAAMWAGLSSIPFSYMKASQAANAFNKDYAGLVPQEMGLTDKTRWVGDTSFPYAGQAERIPGMVPVKDYAFDKMTPWDVLKGGKSAARSAIQGMEGGPTGPATFDFFSKTSRGGKNLLGQTIDKGTQMADWMPTIASQAAGLYGGRMTPEEEWAANKEKRRKELAWMYGVDPELIEGEMTNPWSTGAGGFGGFWNKGGIASLQSGGDVNGPGTGTSDSINANLSDGEFVMTAQAVENFGGGDRYAGARKMYDLMNVLDPESETMQEVA